MIHIGNTNLMELRLSEISFSLVAALIFVRLESLIFHKRHTIYY